MRFDQVGDADVDDLIPGSSCITAAGSGNFDGITCILPEPAGAGDGVDQVTAAPDHMHSGLVDGSEVPRYAGFGLSLC